MEEFLRLQGSLLGSLFQAAAPLLGYFGGGTSAAAGLSELARTVASRTLPPHGSFQAHLLDVSRKMVGLSTWISRAQASTGCCRSWLSGGQCVSPREARQGPWQQRLWLQDLGALLLQACEAPQRTQAGSGNQDYSHSYLYDERRLLQQIGPALIQEVPSARHLALELRCVLPTPLPRKFWVDQFAASSRGKSCWYLDGGSRCIVVACHVRATQTKGQPRLFLKGITNPQVSLQLDCLGGQT